MISLAAKGRVLYLIAAFLLIVAIKAKAGDPLALDWDSQPLDATRTNLESELHDATAQQEINQLTGSLAEVADAKLMIVYLHLYSLLPDKDQSALLSEQKHWLKLRTNDVGEAAKADEGGSAGPMDANTEFVKFTNERCAELEKRLALALKKSAPAKHLK